MLRKIRLRYTIISVVMIVLVSVIINLAINEERKLSDIDSNLRNHIEQSWRTQARRTLTDIRSQFNYDFQTDAINVNDEKSVQYWSKKNLAGVTNGGRSCSSMVVQLKTGKIIYTNQGNLINQYGLDNLKSLYKFQLGDYKNIKSVVNTMLVGNETEQGDNYSWTLYGSKEWVEWVVIPFGKLGFNQQGYMENGKQNSQYNKLLVELGTSESDVLGVYNDDFNRIREQRVLLKIFTAVSCVSMFALVFGSFIFYVYRK